MRPLLRRVRPATGYDKALQGARRVKGGDFDRTPGTIFHLASATLSDVSATRLRVGSIQDAPHSARRQDDTGANRERIRQTPGAAWEGSEQDDDGQDAQQDEGDDAGAQGCQHVRAVTGRRGDMPMRWLGRGLRPD
ncbi:hypothetical protein MHPYR_140079 [uncultured Mycobacterium sp.]|uniref:Uncharacterized protein n=1 Tax=uncultured Mycobacterium sp. TaxID=171292 RepID=A0A1Y5P1R5_9MYCO|nr:hypothetical protein MHPYR_140079 [uncultured Mycobacterium sp.]